MQSGFGINASLVLTPNIGYNSNLGPSLVRACISIMYFGGLRLIGFTVMDNHRVLHGRAAFDGKRRMCGAYIGIDEYHSKLAVLKEKFAPDSVLSVTNDIPNMVVNGRNIWNSAL